MPVSTCMMTIKAFQCNMLLENCYVVSSDQDGEAVVIDCGAYFPAEHRAVTEYIKGRGLHVVHHLLTHGHMDHVYGTTCISKLTGLAPRMHTADGRLYARAGEQSVSMVGVPLPEELPQPGAWLTDNEHITFGGYNLQVIHTPGHSPGSVVFYCAEEQIAFSGDTLFRMSVGRTDLEGGSWEKLMNSLSRLAVLPGATRVYPGHGPATLMAEETKYNPFFTSL